MWCEYESVFVFVWYGYGACLYWGAFDILDMLSQLWQGPNTSHSRSFAAKSICFKIYVHFKIKKCSSIIQTTHIHNVC